MGNYRLPREITIVARGGSTGVGGGGDLKELQIKTAGLQVLQALGPSSKILEKIKELFLSLRIHLVTDVETVRIVQPGPGQTDILFMNKYLFINNSAEDLSRLLIQEIIRLENR